MEYRSLGASGLKVSVLSFGTGTFGGEGRCSRHGVAAAWMRRAGLVDICLDAGVNLFDSADVYSNGAAEEILGAAIKGRRDKVLISTKMSLPMGDGPLDAGSSRHRLLASVEAALRHRDRPDRAADCDRLADVTSHRLLRDHRRSRRGAVAR